MSDPRRINVMLTRPKAGQIIIGDANAIRTAKQFQPELELHLDDDEIEYIYPNADELQQEDETLGKLVELVSWLEDLNAIIPTEISDIIPNGASHDASIALKEGMTCYNCQLIGYMSSQCINSTVEKKTKVNGCRNCSSEEHKIRVRESAKIVFYKSHTFESNTDFYFFNRNAQIDSSCVVKPTIPAFALYLPPMIIVAIYNYHAGLGPGLLPDILGAAAAPMTTLTMSM